MKALCVRQPYAELIARGVKTIEVRTWATPHRGPIVIVASSNWYREDMPEHGLTDRDCPRSAAVCIVDLVDIRRARSKDAIAACSQLDRDSLAWVIERPRRVAPFFVKGKLRVFELPDELIRIAHGAAVGLPACAAAMGCLCAGHARGNAATATCDTTE